MKEIRKDFSETFVGFPTLSICGWNIKNYFLLSAVVKNLKAID